MRIGKYQFKTEPWEHQLQALEYLYPRSHAALYTDMGTGKTKVMIDLIQNRGFKRVLIVCPNKVCNIWEKQIGIHGFKSKILPLRLDGLSPKQKVTKLSEAIQTMKLGAKNTTLVVIINYESVWRNPLNKVLFYKKTGLDCVICDESHRIKSPGSKCSRALTRLGKKVPYRYLMTGTPLAENPCDVYAQYRFLDPSIFGQNIANFKAPYENIDPIMTAKIGRVILNKKEPYVNLDDLREKMFACAFKVKSTVKLPKTRSLKIEFDLTPKTQKLYKKVKKEGALELAEGTLEINNVLTMIIRLQQISGGYLSLEQEDGTTELKHIDASRKEMLSELLQQLPKNEPVVIFAKYTSDLQSIKDVALGLKMKYSEVSGQDDSLPEWQKAKTQVLGVQYQSGSEGLDFTRACYCIYYTLTHSLALYKQSRKRVHRPGQTRPVVYYHIIAKNTIDETILQALKSKQDVVQYVMRNKLTT